LKLSKPRSIAGAVLIAAAIFVMLTLVPWGKASEMASPESLMVVSWSWLAAKLLFSILIGLLSYDRLTGGHGLG